MAQMINSNIMSLNAQNNLNKSGTSMSTTLQRLSSGLRINSAKDDAAGLAISERMTSQIRGLNQASRNANDGISLAQTAEGALGTITNNLQRIRELSVQSVNATNSSSDRQALQEEVDALVAEIDRVAVQTSFNSVNLLDGTFSNQSFQVGAFSGETIDVASIDSARTGDLGQNLGSSATGTAVTGALAAGDLLINGFDVGVADADAKDIAQAINNISNQTNVTAEAQALTVAGSAMTPAALTGTITINSIDTASITTTTDGGVSRGLVVDAINAISAATGVTAVDTGADGTGVELLSADGRSVTVAYTTLTAAATGVAAAGTTNSTIELTGTGADGINLTGAAEADAGFTDNQTVNAQLQGTAISAIDISSASGAETAIESVDAALNAINSSRAELGAVQSRFESVIQNLASSAENLSAARSRIRDADFAQETAELTRTQILQQAGVSVLSQANSQPQLVLSLLQ